MKAKLERFTGYKCALADDAGYGFGATPAEAFESAKTIETAESVKAEHKRLDNRLKLLRRNEQKNADQLKEILTQKASVERSFEEIRERTVEIKREAAAIRETKLRVARKSAVASQFWNGASRWECNIARTAGYLSAYLHKHSERLPPDVLENVRGYQEMIERAIRGDMQ